MGDVEFIVEMYGEGEMSLDVGAIEVIQDAFHDVPYGYIGMTVAVVYLYCSRGIDAVVRGYRHRYRRYIRVKQDRGDTHLINLPAHGDAHIRPTHSQAMTRTGGTSLLSIPSASFCKRSLAFLLSDSGQRIITPVHTAAAVRPHGSAAARMR